MKICVFGASSPTIDKSYIDAVEVLGKDMASHGHSLIFGAGANGLMGACARGVHSQNGEIIGVVPSFFKVDGVLFEHCTKLIYTDTMRERKQIMEDSADAFIITPGGIGTFEEFFEVLTLKQLGRHQKPIVVCNINGYFDSLIALLKNAVSGEFLTEGGFNLTKFVNTPKEALEYIENYTPEDFNILKVRKLKTDE